MIRRDGTVKPWPRDSATPRYRLPYLDIGDWEYWTMGDPVEETTLINRARLGTSTPDAPASRGSA